MLRVVSLSGGLRPATILSFLVAAAIAGCLAVLSPASPASAAIGVNLNIAHCFGATAQVVYGDADPVTSFGRLDSSGCTASGFTYHETRSYQVLIDGSPVLSISPSTDFQQQVQFQIAPGTYTLSTTLGSASETLTVTNTGYTPLGITILDIEQDNAPVASPPSLSLTTAKNTPKSFTISATDPDGDALSYAVAYDPYYGTLSGSGPSYTYTPNLNYVTTGDLGEDSFGITVSDPKGASTSVNVDVTVTDANQAPVASNGTLTTDEDTAASGQLNATDVNTGDTLTYTVGTGPSHGTIDLNATTGAYTYTPAANYNGPDSFSFTASDGTLTSAPATVSIIVTPVNDAPVANGQYVTTDEDTPVNGQVTGGDIDNDPLTFAVGDAPANGTVVINPDGIFTYTPNADFNGSDTFTFTANDGTADSTPATVSITVSPVNDAPVANGQSITTDEDTARAITLTASDVDNDPLTYTVVDQPLHGTLSGTAPNLTYTPNANDNGPDSFTFTANDGTVDSAPATVSITVVAVNDAPVANDGMLTTAEDTAANGQLTATDADNDPLTFALATPATNGTAVVNPDGSYTYTPNANYHGDDRFTFAANDGTIDSDPATIIITVNPVNDAPVADDLSITTAEDTPVTITPTGGDIDQDALTYAIASQPGNGAVTDNGDGTFTYTPNADYNGDDSFTFTANDGALDSDPATVSITVTAVDDAPVVPTDSITLTTGAGFPVSGQLTATDIDSPTLTFSVTQPAHGTVTLDAASGAFTYTPAPNYVGSDSVTYTANDGTLDSNTGAVAITVTPVTGNTAPVVHNDRYNASVVAPMTVPAAAGVLANDTDANGDALIAQLVQEPSQGTLTLNPDGGFTYTPTAGGHGVDHFTYTATDGHGGISQVATVSLNLLSTAPTATATLRPTATATPVRPTATPRTPVVVPRPTSTMAPTSTPAPTQPSVPTTAPNQPRPPRPTSTPTDVPTATLVPTDVPTEVPTDVPTVAPTDVPPTPTVMPTVALEAPRTVLG